MKYPTKTTILLRAIDLELKAILEKDLKAFKEARKNKGNQASQTLLAA